MSVIGCSVIIPTRDRPDQLDACLEALSAQSLPRDRYEVIVVDDGSREPVAPRLGRFASQLNVRHARTPGAGPSAARNAGIELAAGACLAFTDDDCLPDPGWLTALQGALRRSPGSMVGGRTLNLLPHCLPAEASQLIMDIVLGFYNADPDRPRFFTSNNMAVEAALLREVRGFDVTFLTAEDRDLCDRWRLAGHPLVFVSGAVVRHAHRMSLAGFVRQHTGYGRGAYRFMRTHRQRDAATSTLETGFYAGLVPTAARLVRGRQRPAALAALLLVWQLANTAGFLQAWVADAAAPRPGSR